MKHKKKTLLGSSAAIVAALALVAGGTFAGWSDYEIVEDIEASAGQLTLSVGQSTQQSSDPMSLAPGEDRRRDWFIASNDADSVPDADLYLTLEALLDDFDECTSNTEQAAQLALYGSDCAAPNTRGQFSREATIRIQRSGSVDVTGPGGPPACSNEVSYSSNDGGATLVNGTTLDDFEGDKIQVNGDELGPGEGICLRVTVTLPSDASNAVQGDSASWDMRFDLEQS